MKYLIIILSFTLPLAFSHECLKQTDSLDREYCFKKALKKIKTEHSKYISANTKKGVEPKEKQAREAKMKKEIQDNLVYANYLKSESELYTEHLAQVQKLKIKKKEEKKKKKNLLDDLGIKL